MDNMKKMTIDEFNDLLGELGVKFTEDDKFGDFLDVAATFGRIRRDYQRLINELTVPVDAPNF